MVPVTIGAVWTSSAQAQDSFADAFWQFSARTGFDYSSGSYGAATNTDVLFIPVSLKAARGPWTLRMDLSWLRVSGPAVLLDAGATTDPTLGIRTAGSAQGPGDIHLFVTYSLESLYSKGLFIDLTARLKMPTASFSQGLGTGALDGGPQIDVAYAIGKFMPFATLGYRFTGSPPGYFLRDVVYGTAGLQYTWTNKIVTGAFYDIRQAALRTAHTPQEGTAYVNYKFNANWSLNVYATKGFSQNSPDVGGGVAITLRGP